MSMVNIELISAVAKLDSEYVNIELGRTTFLSVTTIGEIAKTFGVNLRSIEDELQLLKDTKYKYDEFCDLCNKGKENEYKLLSDVFEYLEIRKFAKKIVKKVAEKLQNRIYEMNGFNVKTLSEVSEQYNIPVKTLQSRLTRITENIDYRKLGKRQATILTEIGIKKIIE